MSDAKIPFVPLRDRVLVRPTPEADVTAGGIVIPSANKDRPRRGVVVAAGPGFVTPQGVLIPTAVKVGDRVVYGKFSGQELKVGSENLLVMREDEVLGLELPEFALAPDAAPFHDFTSKGRCRACDCEASSLAGSRPCPKKTPGQTTSAEGVVVCDCGHQALHHRGPDQGCDFCVCARTGDSFSYPPSSAATFSRRCNKPTIISAGPGRQALCDLEAGHDGLCAGRG